MAAQIGSRNVRVQCPRRHHTEHPVLRRREIHPFCKTQIPTRVGSRLVIHGLRGLVSACSGFPVSSHSPLRDLHRVTWAVLLPIRDGSASSGRGTSNQRRPRQSRGLRIVRFREPCDGRSGHGLQNRSGDPGRIGIAAPRTMRHWITSFQFVDDGARMPSAGRVAQGQSGIRRRRAACRRSLSRSASAGPPTVRLCRCRSPAVRPRPPPPAPTGSAAGHCARPPCPPS